MPMAGPVRDALVASASHMVDSDDSWAVLAEEDDESDREDNITNSAVGAGDVARAAHPPRKEGNDDMDIDSLPPPRTAAAAAAAAAAQRRSGVRACLNSAIACAATVASTRQEEPVWASEMESPTAAATKHRDQSVTADDDHRMGMATVVPHTRGPMRRRKTVTVEKAHIRLASGPYVVISSLRKFFFVIITFVLLPTLHTSGSTSLRLSP